MPKPSNCFTEFGANRCASCAKRRPLEQPSLPVRTRRKRAVLTLSGKVDPCADVLAHKFLGTEAHRRPSGRLGGHASAQMSGRTPTALELWRVNTSAGVRCNLAGPAF